MTSMSRLISVVLLALLGLGSVAAQSCQMDSDCKSLVNSYSTCRSDRTCSTNPYEQGCLYRNGITTKKRVCNSEDDVDAASKGFCSVADIAFPEVRLISNNWESAIFDSWILQIILSELLEVPTSTETGMYGGANNFYNPTGALDAGFQVVIPAFKNASKYGGDCGLASREADNYEPCGHVATEVWVNREVWAAQGINVELPPQTLGVLGQEGWFIPKFTGEQNPSLLSYLGLKGEANRQMLADTFLRPTTWSQYCSEVSNSSCSQPDDVAQRAPDDTEKDRYFLQDVFGGYFRKTEENDCVKWPKNCTGHIVE
jgi:hypothetical protein